MIYRAFGKTDMNVSALGFGGAETGFGPTSAEELGRILGSALDAGLNVIDTAECYGDGEEKIGKAVSHRRQEFFLFTKCGHASGLAGDDWEPDLLRRSIDRSLSRLQTDCVDLVQLHSCSLEHLRSGEVVEVLQRAREAGKTRYIGYSGDNEAARFAVESGAFDSLQISVSLADQSCLDTVLPAAEKSGIGVIAKRPIANAAWMHRDKLEEGAYARPYQDRLEALAYPFLASRDAASVQIALRFTLTCPVVSTMIVGTTKPGRWEQNAKTVELGPLDAGLFAEIRARWAEVSRPDWIGLT
ncbi:MAG: aldo/keto reductase [Fimbriimonadaceae bacterium]